MASPNVLSAHSLATFIANSIPRDTDPQIKTPYDAIALASHAVMLAVGFRLVGLGEDHKLSTSTQDTTSSPPLPVEWNANSSSGSYAFRYAHTQSSMEYVVKIHRMGSKAVIMGMGLGDDKTNTFDVVTSDYISSSSLPSSPITSTDTDSHAFETARDKILAIFISPGRLSDFGAFARMNLVQKLLPGLQKEGYEESTSAASTSTSTQQQQDRRRPPPERQDPDPLRDGPQPARPHPLADPLAQNPRRPQYPQGDFPPPGFEDEYDMTRPPRPTGGGGIGGGVPGYGQRDLYPAGLGPNDPFRGSMGPGIGGIGGGGGGMHPTFDDPLFGGRGGGAEGGFGYDPQAPPGSRYDPVGPGGRAPRGSHGGPGGGFGGMGGRPPNPFGGFGGGDFI